MKINADIKAYYNNLAPTYDSNRFDNSYGNYIHKQESQILQNRFPKTEKVLDIACGTGRFLEYATHGIDISENMVEISKKKFPNKIILVQDIKNIEYKNEMFNHALSFHLFMHLKHEELDQLLSEVRRVLENDGTFVFDMPSSKRRKLFKSKTSGWHGTNSISITELKAVLKNNWTLEETYGIAFFPIHRIPKALRSLFIPIDNLLCRSIFKPWASYIVYVIRKKVN